MLIDITMKITPKLLRESAQDAKISASGHLGTHFDVMNKEFPLEYTRRDGIVFDVSSIRGRDIDIGDITPDAIQRGMFAAFYTGFSEEADYGSARYFAEHPQLSDGLITLLLDSGVSLIGVDCAGIRRGREHTPADQRCADRGTFVIENLCSLGIIAEHGGSFTAHTYPMNFSDLTGLPCRVIAEIQNRTDAKN